MERIRPGLFLLIGFSILQGCGGGGGGGGGGNSNPPPSGPPPASTTAIGGIYRGTITGCNPPQCPSDIVVVMSEDGEYLAQDFGFLLFPNIGEVAVTNSQFDGSRNLYTPTTEAKSFGFVPTNPTAVATGNNTRSVQGSISERQSIRIDYYHVSPNSAIQVNATYDTLYEEDSSLIKISGTYSVDDGAGFALTYVIDSTGAVNGSDSTGCTVSGNFSVIDTDYNLYRTDLAFSNCGTNGAEGSGYRGLAILRMDSASMPRSLYFYAATDLQAIVLDLPRI